MQCLWDESFSSFNRSLMCKTLSSNSENFVNARLTVTVVSKGIKQVVTVLSDEIAVVKFVRLSRLRENWFTVP